MKKEIKKEKNKKWIKETAAFIAAAVVSVLFAGHGLTQKAIWVLALLAWAVVNWITKVVPDFVVVLLMCCGWILLGIVPFPTAFGSFSNTTMWLLIAALGIGIAVTKSGLLTRAALLVMKRCPATLLGQSAALLISGFCAGPLIPSTTAKVSIVGGVATGIGHMMGYQNRSKEMAGLWSAMYTGYTLLAPVCINASFHGYIIYNLMPEAIQEQLSFGYWSFAMLPWGFLCMGFSLLAIKMLYGPKREEKQDMEKISAMLKQLGPISKEELVTLSTLLFCVILWMLERRLRIPAAVTALLGLCVLLISGILTPQDFEKRLPWNLIIFMGGAINLASVISEVGIDQWLGAVVSPFFMYLSGHMVLFLPAVSMAVLTARFLIADMTTCYSLFILALLPICEASGIHPWLMGMAAYIVIMPWFSEYQNTNFLAAFQAAGGEIVVRHKDLISYCFVFHGIAIVAFILCIPYWKMIQLI